MCIRDSVNPLHGNGGIHFQLATDQNGNSIQNVRALQILSCITGNSCLLYTSRCV